MNHFNISDTTVCIWTDEREDWGTYHAIRDLLRRNRFSFHQDPRIKKQYPCLSKTHHSGNTADIHFLSEIYPTGCQFLFYEDVVRDNPNGGQYHFDKLQKMPYLRRLKAILIMRKVAKLLTSLGFVDQTRPVAKDAKHQIELGRADWAKSHPDMYTKPIMDYNAKDADGQLLSDGVMRYVRSDRTGRLVRGTVYYSANNMWWLLVNRDCCEHHHSGKFFSCEPAKVPRRIHPSPKESITRALARAIDDGRFETAAKIRDAISRLYGDRSFKKGDKVVVDHSRYHGEGVVDYVKPNKAVGVLLENGNTWEYEWATVSPAATAVVAS